MDPAKLLSFLRSSAIPAFDVRIGGYLETEDYSFLSQGIHPHLRSFSIQGTIAVAMGWPADGSYALDDFRRTFNSLNVLHKWHRTESVMDNDFYFVLGRVNRDLAGDGTVIDAEKNMRRFMASSDPISVAINASCLHIVCYEDTLLPVASTRAYAITDRSFTAEHLLQVYDDCIDSLKEGIS